MIINNLTANNYVYDPQRALDFTPYINELSGVSFYYGIGQYDVSNDNNFRIRFDVEIPNFYYTYDTDKINKDFDMYITICPYTASLLNEKYNTNKYISTFFPLPEVSYIENDRPYAVFYSGHKFSNNLIYSIYNTLQKYLGDKYEELITSIQKQDISSYFKKMEIYSKTKICICHNVLIRNTIPNIYEKSNDSLHIKHQPWFSVNSEYIPQIKSRMLEGAMMGCILLVYKDPYNITELYFKENEDFLYYTDENDLENKINMILSDYNKYKFLGENAKKKYYKNYTLRNFMDIIKSKYNLNK